MKLQEGTWPDLLFHGLMGSTYFMLRSTLALFFLIYFCILEISCKIHHLSLQDDTRRNIELTNFGYIADGVFQLELTNFTVPDQVVSMSSTKKERNTDKLGIIGFSFSNGDEIVESIRSQPRLCQLSRKNVLTSRIDALFFTFNFIQDHLDVIMTGNARNLEICLDDKFCTTNRKRRSIMNQISNTIENHVTDINLITTSAKNINKNVVQSDHFVSYIPLTLTGNQYSAKFSIRFSNITSGKYHFMYHNCFNYHRLGYSDKVAVDFTVLIIERNPGSFLSAGDVLKPKLYFILAAIFLVTTFMWVYILKISGENNVFRVHKLMALLVLIKSLSLFFHGINYFFVSIYGHQQEVWAIVYYLMHLLKGALLFGTIILIGTGYTFFKNFLTDRDRKLFMIVLPLQVLDNIALVIIDESEVGEQFHQFWSQIFILLDLLCCAAILLPVVWSMRHLQEGAQIDGKAAFNLEKLKLFRHFYMIIIGYIYLTRIIKFIVLFTVPFNYVWIITLVEEVGTLLFFVITGYKFRPAEYNPYLRLNQEENLEMDEPLTKSGVLENVQRVKRKPIEEKNCVLIENERENFPTLGTDGSEPELP